MKKLYILITLLMIGFAYNQNAIAQGNVKAAKVSLMTERMQLTATQAQKFWPIYNKYDNERRSINRQIRNLKKSGNANGLKTIQNLEKQKLQLKNKYQNQFLGVISQNQLAKMYSAEEEFKEKLLEKMNED